MKARSLHRLSEWLVPGDYGQSSCQKCAIDETTPLNGSRSCIAVQPSDDIKVVRTEPMDEIVLMEWEAKGNFENVTIMFSILSANNETKTAIMQNILILSNEKMRGQATNILFGLKVYFHVSGVTKDSTKVLSFPSEPVVIVCPPMACCGVETDDERLCLFNLPYGVTVKSMAARVGAFQVNGTTFSACPEESACLGGSSSNCSKGYMGLLCHRCMTGFARSGVSRCRLCDVWTVPFILFGLFASVAICIYLIKSTLETSEKTVEIEMAKIGMGGLQALTVLGRYPLKWPPEVLAIFDIVGSAFSAAGEVVSFQCAMTDENGSRYVRGAAVVLGLPILVILVVAIFWIIHSVRIGERKRTKSNFIVSIMVILFLVLPTLNQTAFRLLTCTEIMPGMVHVAGDLQLPCYRGMHLAYVIGMAIPSFLLYAIGIPWTALFILYRMHKKNKLFASREESYSANVYKFLYGGYDVKAYYWETVIMLRKVFLNVVLVVMAPSPPLAQALTVLLVLFVFLLFHMKVEPYSNVLLNRIELSSLLLSITMLFFGIYLFNDDVRRVAGKVITMGMVTLLCTSLLAFVAGMIWFSRKKHADDAEQAVGTAKRKTHNAMQTLKDRASKVVEMTTIRIRSSINDEARDVRVSNPMVSHDRLEK